MPDLTTEEADPEGVSCSESCAQARVTFDKYWDEGGASQLRKRSSSQEVKEAARQIWQKALKHGRTDNDYVNMSFVQFWKAEGIGEEIDRKNRWRLIFTIDKSGMKAAMREIWDDAVEIG